MKNIYNTKPKLNEQTNKQSKIYIDIYICACVNVYACECIVNFDRRQLMVMNIYTSTHWIWNFLWLAVQKDIPEWQREKKWKITQPHNQVIVV